MTRADIETAVYRDFGYADSPATAVTNRIRAYVNDRHRRLLTLPGTEKLRAEIGTFATVASTSAYALDMPIAKILKLSDTTNDSPLYERGLDWYRLIEPDPTAATGQSEYWIRLREGPALRNVGGAGLWVVSTSAADAQSTTVETINTAGSITTTNTTLNGVTRVQVGTATTHQRLVRFSVASAAAGEVELYDAATDGNLVSQIEVGRTTAQFVTIALWPTPSAANTIQVDYIHHIRDLTVAASEPQLPLDFHWLVAVGAKIDEARQKGSDDRRAREWLEEYRMGSRALVDWLVSYDTIYVPGELTQRGRSNLGGAYPAGIW